MLLTRRLRLAAAVAGLALSAAACGGSGSTQVATADGASRGTLRVSGSTTVNPVAADAAEALRTNAFQITVDTQGGSAGGLAQLGAGQIDVAMSSKPVGEADRTQFPSVAFTETQIGEDAVGIVLRKEVVDGGVSSLTKTQLAGIFEGRTKNWKEVGGPDLAIFVYDKEPGRGTREVLDKFLYGKDGKAPPPPDSNSYAIVGGNEETRTKLESTPGSVGPLSTGFLVGHPDLVAVAVAGVEPSTAHIVDRTYPLSRPLFLVTNGPATGLAKVFVDYVLSPAGQKLVTKHDYLTLAQLKG